MVTYLKSQTEERTNGNIIIKQYMHLRVVCDTPKYTVKHEQLVYYISVRSTYYAVFW